MNLVRLFATQIQYFLQKKNVKFPERIKNLIMILRISEETGSEIQSKNATNNFLLSMFMRCKSLDV